MRPNVNHLFLLLLVTILLDSSTSTSDLVYPDTPGVVYSPVHMNVSIPCLLTFPDDESLELIMWYQGTTYILYKGSDGNLKHRDDSLIGKFGIEGDNYTLTVTHVRAEDTGNYTCKKSVKKQVDGSLEFLESNSTSQLIVQDIKNLNLSDEIDDDNMTNITLSDDVPSPPGMPEVSNVNSRYAVVSWLKSLQENNSPITKYIINVKRIKEPDWEKSRVLQVEGDTTSITIRDLIPNTAYQIRVLAKNALGNSEPSSPSGIFMTSVEAPEKPPMNVKGHSPSSKKIVLTWDIPPEDTINGQAGGYLVEYKKEGEIPEFMFTIEDSTRKTANIENLEPFTRYIVSIKLFNEVDSGPAAVVHVRTSEGVPDRPRITHYSEMKSTSFVVNWEAPKVENGVLKNYQLQWIHNNTYKTRIITGHLTKLMSAHITGLQPYTQYQIRVRAETGGGYSNYSDLFPGITDVAGPSSPRLLNLTIISPNEVFIYWDPPDTFYKKIDSYFIQYKGINTNVGGEQLVDGAIHEKLVDIKDTNHAYIIKVCGVTQSIFSQSYFFGDYSEEMDFVLIDPDARVQAPVEVVSAGAVAGIVLGVVFIFLIMALIVGYRSMTCRKYTRSLYYLAVPTSSQSPQSTFVFPPNTIDEDTKYPEIKVADFLKHNRAMHADSDNGFSTEFEEISSRTRTDLMAEASYQPENKAKNRYVNISAFDHSRVILQPIQGRPRSSDYINGNFIDGYQKPNAYIATQGPLPHTFSDYWRMVWEQGSIVIVMITNLVERGRRKCDLYWPEEGTETYGSVTVKHINTFSRAHYTVRMFSLKSSKIKKKHVSERIVYQYHYTEWPDHGVPDFTLPVLKFIQKSSSDNPPGAGPIVIHCSAGVGRTGTYILIETMIKQIKDKGTINIPKFLLHIRQQRNFLVQTEEQYMLIHDAIEEYIVTQGDTEIREGDIIKCLAELKRTVNGEQSSLDIQYSLVTSFNPKPDDMFHALKNVNLAKNRSLDLVPLSVKRVLLPMKPGVEGSDYINATYLHGYNKSNEFIITQHPLEQTMEDFWRMVWDQNSSVIVQLSDVDGDEFKSYWPEKDTSIDIGCFRLTYREDDNRKNYVIREFLLQSTQDDYILMTRIVTPNDQWPDTCNPRHHVFDLIDTVQTLHKQNDIGPVIVVDRYGGVEAATFCALWTLFDQLQYDKAINIYQLAKLYHLKRVGVIGTRDNYHFLYNATESLSKEWIEKDKQSSPSSVRLNLGSIKKNGTLPRSVTINSKIETDV